MQPAKRKPNDPLLHPTIVAIFDKLYHVSIPTLQMQTIKEQERFGIRVTGDRDVDNAMRSQRTYTYISIDSMVEYFREGVSVGVANMEDCKEIYEVITEHLNQWGMHVKRVVHHSRTPLNDLVLLDKFAHTVYKHARYLEKPDWLYSPLSSVYADSDIGLSMSMLSGPRFSMTENITEREFELQNSTQLAGEREHETLADIFKVTQMRKRM